MTNLEEFTHGFDPTVDDGFADADFDRYPNVWEVRNGSDPNSASSTPAATYTVNAAGRNPTWVATPRVGSEPDLG